MTGDMENRKFPRVPLENEVRIEFTDIGELVSDCSANISLGGMFIKTAELQPVGSTLRFELSVGANRSVIRGRAEVVWIRTAAVSPDEPAGMGLRFMELDDNCRANIFRIVDNYIQTAGGEPFELDSGP